ncbi:uncharacterized protein LOC143244639 isoform X1 [Tachypleus tridentatus]|uniref:uncharacterized protein LOC143244639 isoform X1 n=1 Tax=Tachypleus tridentatus TaxID=6853 RepID=UPI003FD32B83
MDPLKNLNKIVKKQSIGKQPRLEYSEQQSSTSVTHIPHFLILHSLTEKPLGQMSPFFIQKGLEGLVGSPKSVKKLRSGDILVETSTSQHSELLLNSKAIGDIPIEVTPHTTLNSSRGVIVERDLKNVPESEILAGLSTQGVSGVRHISTRKDGVTLPTNTLVLTFTSPRAPATIKAGYLICRVWPYIPNPLRCFQCQRFGHSKTSCRGSLTCARCGGKDHDAYDCDMNPHCINCKGSHPSYFHSCPKWLEEKEVQRLKTTHNISYPEARKLLSITPSRTYAAALHSTTTVGVQTDLFVPPRESFSKQMKSLLTSVVQKVDESTSTPISVPPIPSNKSQDPRPSVSNTGISSDTSFSPTTRDKTIIRLRPQSLDSPSNNKNLPTRPRAGSMEVGRPPPTKDSKEKRRGCKPKGSPATSPTRS